MVDRSFSDVELREMMQVAGGYHPDVVEGRWVIETRHKRRNWEVIVEPDQAAKLLVVVTAYPLARRKR
jgi:hypothetical protein